MSLNPVDIFQNCYTEISKFSSSSSSSSSSFNTQVMDNIRVNLSSLLLHNNSDVDCIREEVRQLRNKIELLSPQEVHQSIRQIWMKWFDQKTHENTSENASSIDTFEPNLFDEAVSVSTLLEVDVDWELQELNKLIYKWKGHCCERFENLDISSFDRDFIVDLIDWMRKIAKSNDFKHSVTRRKLSARVLSIIEFANLDTEYRQLCITVIKNSTGYCQDGGALGINTLELEKKIRQSDELVLSDLVKLLRGSFAASLLEEAALKIVYDATSSNSDRAKMDPIEIFLALQIKYRDVFDLPFECENMDFFYMANLSPEQLNAIETNVRNSLDDQEQVAQYLLNQYSWKVRLETVWSQEVKQIQDDLFTKLDSLESSKDTLTSAEYGEKCKFLKDEYEDLLKVWLKSKTDSILEESNKKESKKRKATSL